MRPLDAAQSRAAFPFQSSNRPLHSGEAAAIAVVDPDGRARAAATQLCERDGYRVLPFASGEEFLRAGPPDYVTCVVLDVFHPPRDDYR